MKTLKQKWIDALPVFASVFFMLGIVILFSWGMYRLVTLKSEPDTRTVEEVKTERYKNCLEYSSSMRVQNCDNYLLPVPNTQ
tara:strand:+ start:70 stop:315 length:246 start_codon:yes stop_codon:yes gene_type:complete